MIEIKTLKDIVNDWLKDKDYFLTDLSVSEDDRIVVEIDHKEGVWIDDCVALSKYIESRLSDSDNYELEVGSAGIGQPFKVLQQYINHIGDEVEIVTNAGEKLKGTLKAADEHHFTAGIKKKIKPEGAKRPKTVEEDVTYAYGDVKSVKYIISFK